MGEDVRGLKLKNANFIGLVRWLQGQQLQGKQSRLRTNFVDVCMDHVKAIDEHRIELLKQYAHKDDKGNYVMITDELGRENYDIDDPDMAVLNKEFEKFMDEEYVIALPNETWQAGHLRKLFGFVSELLESTTHKFQGKEAEDYDRWCSAFEALGDADVR